VEQRPLKEVLDDFRSPAAVLFALLLFFQFGNEWSLAGWLPLLLIQRLGISPLASLLLLALYFFCLLVGRVVAQWLLPVVHHGKLLMTSSALSLFGCLILALTNNLFGAGTAVVFIGGGFAITYPLVIEKIGLRFRYYHPTLFNSIFSLAILGGLLAPWTLGFFAQTWSVRAVMVVPLGGTLIVSVLLVLIWAEAKLTGVR
jgi:fucose permease